MARVCVACLGYKLQGQECVCVSVCLLLTIIHQYPSSPGDCEHEGMCLRRLSHKRHCSPHLTCLGSFTVGEASSHAAGALSLPKERSTLEGRSNTLQRSLHGKEVQPAASDWP